MKADDPRAALEALVAARPGESLMALSKLIGRNETYLQQYLRRGSPRRLAEADRRLLARYLGVAEAVLGGPEATAPPAAVRVPRLAVRASAGPGALNAEEAALDQPEFPLAMLRRLGVGHAALALIVAEGDSMEPLIRAGDQMLVDQADTRPGTRAGVFVLRAGDATLVKRVRRRGGTLEVTSDNPAAPPVTGDVTVIGRVVWLGRRL